MKNEIYHDSYNEQIMPGDVLMIIATNQYSGEVNLVNGELYLNTNFFNKPLHEHLTAVDFQYCDIEKEKTGEGYSTDCLPF